MLRSLVQDVALRRPAAVLLETPQGELGFSELAAAPPPVTDSWREGDRVGVVCSTLFGLLRAVVPLSGTAAQICLFPPEVSLAEAASRVMGMLVVDDPSTGMPTSGGSFVAGPLAGATPSLVLFTSGTTGKPKPVVHSWASLCRHVRRLPEFEGQRWWLTYHPSRFAGLQVLLHASANGCRLLWPDTLPTWDERLDWLADRRVECASGTPSFWRRLLIEAGASRVGRKLCLRQVTLGGEIADEHILRNLAQVFPQARLTHVYASTECGFCFSVSDGHAGFPAALLGSRDGGLHMKIEDGELVIFSPARMVGNLHGDTAPEWIRTGDLVELRGDRVFFTGRRDDRINVGGHKVNPVEVEQAILGCEGVAGVRVIGQANPILGMIPAAEVVPTVVAKDLMALERSIRESCRKLLSASHQPRIIRFVRELPRSTAEKLIRYS